MADELDLDALVDKEAEALGEPHKVTWGGETFLVPRMANWPIETFDVLMQGELAAGLAIILDDQWEAFYTARKPSMSTANVFLDGIAQREGFDDLGESLASSPTPNRATRRSRQTSSGSTA